MNYNIITNTEATTGYYNFPIGTETYFVLYADDIEIINTVDNTERYTFPVQGNIQTLKEIEISEYPGAPLEKAIIISYHKLGFQIMRLKIADSKVQASFDDMFYVDTSSSDLVQIGDYIIYCNDVTHINESNQNTPSPALTVIKLMVTDCSNINSSITNCDINYIGIYDANTVYSECDLVDYPITTTHIDGTSETTYTKKYTPTGGLGEEATWIEYKPTMKNIGSTVELFDSHTVLHYNDGTSDKIVVDATNFGILIYDFDSLSGSLTLENYFQDSIIQSISNYNHFIVKDSDYIYYNKGHNLCKLNITDFTDFNSYEFKENVNQINIKDGYGKIITDTKVFDVNLNLFNDTETTKETTINQNGVEIIEADVIKIAGDSPLNYAYLYLEDTKSKMKIANTTRIIDICSGTAKDICLFGNEYHIIDSDNIYKIYDVTKDNFIFEEITEYNNVIDNILYQGSKQKTIENIQNTFNETNNEDLDDDLKTMVVTKEENINKLKNQELGTVLMEKLEYEFKIAFAKNNIIILYNEKKQELIIKNIEAGQSKNLYGVQLFTVKDNVLYIFSSDSIESTILDTTEPCANCITLDETPITLNALKEDNSSNCTKIESGSQIAQSSCSESITKILKLPIKDKFLLLYNVKSLNTGIFDSSSSEIQYFLEGDEQVQDVLIEGNFVYFIKNNSISIFEVISDTLVPDVVIDIDEILFPKAHLNSNILVLTSKNNIVYIDLSDKSNPIILKTVYDDYIYDSEIAIFGTRLFICSTSGVKEFVFDISGIDYNNVQNSSTLISTGTTENLDIQSKENIAYSLCISNNSLYYISLPSDEIMYALSSGKYFKPLNKFMFGYGNVLVDDHYRLFGDNDYRTELVKIDIVTGTETDYETDYRILEIQKNNSMYFLRTDENIISRNTFDSGDIVQAGVSKLFDVNDNFLLWYNDNILYIKNLNNSSVTTLSINNIKYLRVDKSNDIAYYQSNSAGYYLDINSGVSTQNNIVQVKSSFYNNDFISVQGSERDIEEGDKVKSIFNKEIASVSSVPNQFDYDIGKSLYNIEIYIDNKKYKDFIYNSSTGIISLNYPFTGYEKITYTYLSEPFYGSDNKKYVYKYKSETSTATPKGTDEYGNEIYDNNDLDTAQVPGNMHSANGIVKL